MRKISQRIIIKWHPSRSLLRLDVEADRLSRHHQFFRKKYSRRRRSSESFENFRATADICFERKSNCHIFFYISLLLFYLRCVKYSRNLL